MRVLVVEDSAYMADALVHLLNLLPDLAVAAQVSCQSEALFATIAHRPDLAILDLQIKECPGGAARPEHGIATIQALRRLFPKLRMLVFSMLPEKPWLRAAAQAGAVGFLSKNSSSTEIIAALQAIRNGMVAFTYDQLRLLQEPLVDTSKREREVLALLSTGLSNQEIAQQLGISVGTARKHVENLYSAFGVHTRGRLIALAYREGLVALEE
jgi:two-component system response regulator DesR